MRFGIAVVDDWDVPMAEVFVCGMTADGPALTGNPFAALSYVHSATARAVARECVRLGYQARVETLAVHVLRARLGGVA